MGTKKKQVESDISIYKLTEDGRELPFKQWVKLGGCLPSNSSEYYVSQKLKKPVSKWDDLTLGELADIYVVIGREFARYAFNNFPTKKLSEIDI